MQPVTLLTARGGKTFAKVHRWTGQGWSTTAYDHVSRVDAETLLVNDLNELSALLLAIESARECCIIRGRLIDGDTATNIRRLSIATDDCPATFTDQASNVVMMDIDDLTAPADLTMAQRVAWIIRSLPAPFQTADFHLQWSSGAGLKGWTTLKAHLWFWLDEPTTSEMLRQRAQAEKWAVDHQVFKSVQPHYTAAPTFIGATDPLLGQRSIFVQRERRTVSLPPWSPPPPPVVKTAALPSVQADDPAYKSRVEKWMAAIIERSTRDIVDAIHGSQNVTIYSSSRSLGRLVAGGLLDESEAVAFLQSAASQGGHPSARARATIRSGLNAGKRQPIYGPPD